MIMFQKKLESILPVIERHQSLARNGIVKHQIYFKNRRRTDWSVMSIPYVEEVQNFLEKKNGFLCQRILLVTENENVAMKAAAYIKEHSEDYLPVEMEEDDYDYELWYGDEDEEDNYSEMVRVVDLSKGITQEKGISNSYVPLLSEVDTGDMVLFTGLTCKEDIVDKLEVIGVCQAYMQCIQVSPSRMKETWVQELLLEYPCDILPLSDLEDAYYESVIEQLLNGENISLETGLMTSELLRRMRKNRGRKFREEDIARHLDLALECGMARHPRSLCLLETDFEQLSFGEEKPMEKLLKMPGLKEVKIMAKEFAAIAKEELQNKKLGVLHKNMLFLGNPGTGKTTCARLLADIMVAEGNVNANFVQADRKDLLGEYVGHTAPKVAKCFEEARGGILFVDEAGFFLHSSSGGYVEEAIKEFVRYMEIYPDVTVIFAMYPEEARRFMKLDAGLASRISRCVLFEDYTDEELCAIAEAQLQEKGYILEKQAQEEIKVCMEQLRRERNKSFGNAREVRKLTESAVIAFGMRHYGKKRRNMCITSEDVREGFLRLQQESAAKQSLFGFQSNTSGNIRLSYGA